MSRIDDTEPPDVLQNEIDERADVRGWEVMGADGVWVGEVDNLVMGTASRAMRYLDVDLNEDLFEEDAARHVLIPIDGTRLDPDRRQIFVDALASTDVGTLPEYQQEPLTREHEQMLRRRFESDRDRARGSVRSRPDHREGDLPARYQPSA